MDYLIYTVYDLIILKSVCTVIQEYCRRKDCVLISYDLKWKELAMIMCKKQRSGKFTSSFVTNWMSK